MHPQPLNLIHSDITQFLDVSGYESIKGCCYGTALLYCNNPHLTVKTLFDYQELLSRCEYDYHNAVKLIEETRESNALRVNVNKQLNATFDLQDYDASLLRIYAMMDAIAYFQSSEKYPDIYPFKTVHQSDIELLFQLVSNDDSKTNVSSIAHDIICVDLGKLSVYIRQIKALCEQMNQNLRMVVSDDEHSNAVIIEPDTSIMQLFCINNLDALSENYFSNPSELTERLVTHFDMNNQNVFSLRFFCLETDLNPQFPTLLNKIFEDNFLSSDLWIESPRGTNILNMMVMDGQILEPYIESIIQADNLKELWTNDTGDVDSMFEHLLKFNEELYIIILLEKYPGIVYDVLNGDYDIALHIVARYGYCNLMKLLLETGDKIQLSQVNGNGQTPLTLIEQNQDESMLLMLSEEGYWRLGKRKRESNNNNIEESQSKIRNLHNSFFKADIPKTPENVTSELRNNHDLSL